MLANAILTAESTLASAQAARIALDVARQARIDMEIRAPVPTKQPDGVTEPITYAVSKRSVSEGQMLKQGDPVVELVVENPLRLWATVPERHSDQVQLGQPVRLSVTTFPDTTFDGQVVRINPTVEPSSRTFQVEALIPNNRKLLRPGGFAKASILIDKNAEATVVPIESVMRYAGVTKIFVVESGASRAIEVETGQEKARAGSRSSARFRPTPRWLSRVKRSWLTERASSFARRRWQATNRQDGRQRNRTHGAWTHRS